MHIRPGDTLTSIAQQQGTSVEALLEANPQIQDPNLIYAGDSLNVPGAQDQFQNQAAPQGGMPSLDGAPQGTAPGGAPQGTGAGTPTASEGESLDLARSLIGRAYGDPGGASAAPVGADSPFMHCAQFVNAVYPDLPASAPQLNSMADPNATPGPGDVITSDQPAPWGHVGIMTESGSVIHSIPGVGVHESSLAEFEQYSPVTGVIAR